MAVGWPTKTTYANGDVYSASDVNDTNGTINLLTSSTLSRAAGKNAIINGGFDIWQRGTSIALAASTTAANGYSADRWDTLTNANQATTISRQVTGDTTNLPNVQYCARYQRNSGQTGTAALYFVQSIETTNSLPMAGQAVTVSFYARRGANYSPTSNALAFFVQTGTGTDQNQPAGYTGAANIVNSSATLTTTWQRFTATGTIGATATEIAVIFGYTPTGTAGAADYFEVTGVQLELGSTATTFSRAQGTIQGELAACQRYYEKSYRQAVVPGSSGADTNDSVVPISSVANNESYQTYRFAVTKRTDATITTYSYNGVTNRSSNSSGTDYGANSADPWRSSQSMFIVRNSSGSSMTIDAARFIYLNWTASAEL